MILGYLNPTRLAGGAVKLNAARAHEVFEEKVARPLGMPLVEAAHGAHLIAASNMMRAIRAVSSERGRDPREYALFAFGGNGPLFAAGMAEQLEMRRIVVPPAPGLFSSFGLLYADVEHHYVRTWRRLVRERRPGRPGRAPAAAWRRTPARSSPPRASRTTAMRLRRSADCRYQGQSFELTVPVADGPIDAATLAALAEAFGQEHERTYGHRAGADEPVEIVSLRVVGPGVSDRPRVPETLRIDRPGGRRPAPRAACTSAPTSAGARRRSSTAPTSPRRARARASSRSTTRRAWCRPARARRSTRYGNIVIELGQEI